MKPDILKNLAASDPWLAIHPLSEEDSVAAAGLRAAVAPFKGMLAGTAGREPFNHVMEMVAVPKDVVFEAGTVGGIPGRWAKPPYARKGAAIMHAHGGWFNLGTAQSYQNFAGQIALIAGADLFIPDYRLAPESPFPAAVRDLQACYQGLIDERRTTIAITGDSAGGNLALVLLSILTKAPVGAVVFSPITDLTLSGKSYGTRAEAEMYFTKSQAAGLISSYLGTADPRNPEASPLYADLTGLPPVRVHVGYDEVLLDDSVRYVERAVAAGVDAKLDLWTGMPHGFVANIGMFSAATEVLEASGAFLRTRMNRAR